MGKILLAVVVAVKKRKKIFIGTQNSHVAILGANQECLYFICQR